MNSWNAPPKSRSETYFSLRAARALQTAFAPINTESLATFIFSPTPRIPPKAFAASLVLHITHRLTHSGLSDPRRAFRAPTLMFTPRTESASVNLVLTPLRHLSNCLVGVVNAAGVTPNGSVMPFSEALNHGIQRGRFVYNAQSRHMLCLLDGLSEDSVGVVSAKWLGDGKVRERYFFSIPKKQYSLYDMPKSALVVLTNLEYQVAKMHQGESISDCSTSQNTGNDPLFKYLTETVSSTLQNGVETSQKRDSFDMSSLTRAMENLARSLSGLYYGPNLKRDVINISTGELSSRASGKIVARLSIPDSVGQCRIRRMVAQDYFLQLLPPGSERWFLQNKDERNLGLALDEIEDDGIVIEEKSRVGDGDPLLPDLQFIEQAGVGQASVTDVIPERGLSTTQPSYSMSSEDLKKQKDEERRIRNRLSAARSNERRKERERAQMVELERLKEKKAVLETVQRRLIDENDVLRKCVERLVQ